MCEPIFDEKLLASANAGCVSKNSTFPRVDENLILRPLSSNDYEKGFLDVLAELTEVGSVDEKSFADRFNSMKSCPNSYFVIVVEDTEKELVVASATLVLEQKFIHECATRGRIEDVVVSSSYRKRDLGKILVSTLLNLSDQLNCYKVTLDCKDALVPFYEGLGLRKEAGNSNYMQKRVKRMPFLHSCCSRLRDLSAILHDDRSEISPL